MNFFTRIFKSASLANTPAQVAPLCVADASKPVDLNPPKLIADTIDPSKPAPVKDVPTNVGFRSFELKIKVTSLAAEIKLIRENERRLKRMAREATNPEYAAQFRKSFWSLRDHSETICEPIAREAQLAYGFLRGIPYSKMEKKRYTDPRWDQIERSIVKHGGMPEQILKQRFEQWKQEAGKPTPLSEKQARREQAKATKKAKVAA